jgi:hypothetical protein
VGSNGTLKLTWYFARPLLDFGERSLSEGFNPGFHPHIYLVTQAAFWILWSFPIHTGIDVSAHLAQDRLRQSREAEGFYEGFELKSKAQI